MHGVYPEIGLAGIAGRSAGRKALIIDVEGCFLPQKADKPGLTYWRH